MRPDESPSPINTKNDPLKNLKDNPSVIYHSGLMLVALSILMFLSWFRIDIMTYWQISFAWLLTIAVIIYYFFLNVRIAAVTAIVMIIITALFTWLAHPAPTMFSFSLFLILLVVGLALIFTSNGVSRAKTASQLTELLLIPYTVVSDTLDYFGLKSHLGL